MLHPKLKSLKGVFQAYLSSKYIFGTLALLIIVTATTGAWYNHELSIKSNAASQQNAALLKAEGTHRFKQSKLTGAKAQSSDTSSAADTKPPTSASSTTTKYAASPDPRSTAYSTTPPAPNPASFSTNITHAGQVAPGTLIDYNGTKDVKTYYGGDLQFSSTNFIAASNLGPPDFTVTIPDGQVSSIPTEPWNDQSSYATVATKGPSAPATSWDEFLHFFTTPPSSHTTPYIFHLQSIREASGNPNVSYEYDGFITVYYW